MGRGGGRGGRMCVMAALLSDGEGEGGRKRGKRQGGRVGRLGWK